MPIQPDSEIMLGVISFYKQSKHSNAKASASNHLFISLLFDNEARDWDLHINSIVKLESDTRYSVIKMWDYTRLFREKKTTKKPKSL